MVQDMAVLFGVAGSRLTFLYPFTLFSLHTIFFFVSWRLQELVLNIYRNRCSVAIREDCFVNRIAGHISLAFYFLEVPSVQHLPGNAYSLWFQNILSAILFIWEQDWCKTMVPTWLCLIASCIFSMCHGLMQMRLNLNQQMRSV